jgi:hypothetical protein
MKVQIIVDSEVKNTQLISVEALGQMPPMRAVKLRALRAALDDRAISVSQSLQATFRLYDVAGKPFSDDEGDG